jgi:PTH1 family peptidyl-tRNA hydrolase
LFCSVAGQRFDAGRTGNVYFLEPETFMNLSGESAREAAAFYKIPPENILVVHDELELAPGVVALKKGGGLGGHNGLRSLKSCLNSADFWRLRIGIGRPDDRAPGKGGGPEHHGPIDKWVLSNFTAEEADLFNTVFTECSTALFTALAKGPEALLPEWTKKRISIERNNYEQ